MWVEVAVLPGRWAGVTGPPVDLTITSRAEMPSDNNTAANHHMVGSLNTRCSAVGVVFANRDLRFCGLLYDRMMISASWQTLIDAGDTTPR